MQGIAQKVLANPGRYSIQQLQQGVQTGTIPAYIAVPLIQEKVQQQKQMQMAQAMQAQQQPPVAQQVMSEAQGIEELPTNLPQEYAGGGIIAFDEGGEVPRFQFGGLNDPMGTGASAIVEAGGTGLPYVGRNLIERLFSAPDIPDWKKQLEMERILKEREGVAQPASAAQPAKSESLGLTGLKAAQDTNLGLRPNRVQQGITGAPKLKLPEGESYESMANRYYEDYGRQAERNESETENKINMARNRVQGKAFAGLEDLLKAEKEAEDSDKKQAASMALFKAGLKMLSGTSPFALANIGAGGAAGLEDYQAAMKDIKRAEKERQKQFAYIEQARRAEDIGDRDTEIKSIENARDRADTRARYIGEGIFKATGMDKAVALDMAKTQFGSDSDIFRTNLTGQYQLKAAELGRQNREGINLYQMARLRQEAEKRVDPDAVRAELAKQLKLSKVPPAGKDPSFDERFRAAYDNAINTHIDRYLGGSGAGGGGLKGSQNPYEGYKLVPSN
jgi:hypothetical protein